MDCSFQHAGAYYERQGIQFTSALWSQLARLLGVTLYHTTAYLPQSKGLVERFHHHLKSALMASLSGPDWEDELPWVLLGIRTVPKEDLQSLSAEMVYGTPLSMPGEFFGPQAEAMHSEGERLTDLRKCLGNLTPPFPSHHDTQPSHRPKELDVALFVFVRWGPQRARLQRPYEGPYNVLWWSGGLLLQTWGAGGIFYRGPFESCPLRLISTGPGGCIQMSGSTAQATGHVAGSGGVGVGFVAAHSLMVNRPQLYCHVAGQPLGDGVVRGFFLAPASLSAHALVSDYDITMHQMTELMLPL
ncbi:uncharacterized protein [Narcine bancroftii]|uniref:uncharacterized protein n=1 Tax=Narcine bancroftii TaxID=1343680 RepID=UPI0038313C67